MTRVSRVLVLLVAAAATLPLGAGAADAVPHQGHKACSDLLMGHPWCALDAQTALEAVACDAEGCTFVLDAHAAGRARLVGLMHLETRVVTSPAFVDGLCLSPDPTTPGEDFCGRVCAEDALGALAACAGEGTFTLPLAAGECGRVVATSTLEYDGGAGFAGVALVYVVCRDGSGEPVIAAA